MNDLETDNQNSHQGKTIYNIFCHIKILIVPKVVLKELHII